MQLLEGLAQCLLPAKLQRFTVSKKKLVQFLSLRSPYRTPYSLFCFFCIILTLFLNFFSAKHHACFWLPPWGGQCTELEPCLDEEVEEGEDSQMWVGQNSTSCTVTVPKARRERWASVCKLNS